MSSLQQRCDFMTNVVRTAIMDGWTKDEFMKLAETAWLVLTSEREQSEAEVETGEGQ